MGSGCGQRVSGLACLQDVGQDLGVSKTARPGSVLTISLRRFAPPPPRKWGASRAWDVGERAVTTRGHCKGNYFGLGRCQLLALPFPSPPGNPLGLLPQMYWYFPSSWFQAALLGRANMGLRRQSIERESPLGFCLTAGTQQGNPT